MADADVVSEELLEELTEEILCASEDKLLELEEKLVLAADRLLAEMAELLIVDDSELLDELRSALELVTRLLTAAEVLEAVALLLDEGAGLGTRLLATELALLTGVGLAPPPPPPPQALNNPDMTKTLRIPRD